MLRLREKFHTEHMLDKEDSDKFDALLTELVKGLDDKYAEPII